MIQNWPFYNQIRTKGNPGEPLGDRNRASAIQIDLTNLADLELEFLTKQSLRNQLFTNYNFHSEEKFTCSV